MQDINDVTLIGRLTKDPELRTTAAGKSVCQLRIAVNNSRRNPTGEYEDVAGFFNVTLFDKQAENAVKFLSRGSQVGVQGYLNHRTWETQEGAKRDAVEIVANRVQFLTPKSDAPKQDAAQAPAYDDVPY